MRVQSPIAGGIAGAAGNLIFQHYHGRTFGRAFPAIFHYQPTPAQYAAQTKYYGTRREWNPLYQAIKPFIPKAQLKQANAFNNLSAGAFKALGVFPDAEHSTQLRKFGFDVENRLLLYLNNWTLYYAEPYYYVTFWDFDFQSYVAFTPRYAHALYFCRDLQQIEYNVVDFDPLHLTFIFDNSRNWFPDHDFDMYVALSDEQYFSNFFF